MCYPPPRDEYRIEFGLRSTQEDDVHRFFAQDKVFKYTREELGSGWFAQRNFVTVTHLQRGVVACALLQPLDDTNLLIKVIRISCEVTNPDMMLSAMMQDLISGLSAGSSLQVRCWDRAMSLYTSTGFVHTHSLHHETMEREAVLCFSHCKEGLSELRRLDERNPAALELLTKCAGKHCHGFGVMPCDMVRSDRVTCFPVVLP